MDLNEMKRMFPADKVETQAEFDTMMRNAYAFMLQYTVAEREKESELETLIAETKQRIAEFRLDLENYKLDKQRVVNKRLLKKAYFDDWKMWAFSLNKVFTKNTENNGNELA